MRMRMIGGGGHDRGRTLAITQRRTLHLLTCPQPLANTGTLLAVLVSNIYRAPFHSIEYEIMGSEDQLVSFFAYSIFVYPVARYLVSPERKYNRWKGVLYAFLFLGGICAVQIYYEKSEAGPNFFQLLGVGRDSTESDIKKAFRNLSRILHPDKNKSPDAALEFQKVQHAYQVLYNAETRDIYNRLGLRGLQTFVQHTVTIEYIVTNLMVSYASALVMAFLMTLGEPEGEAWSFCVMGLAVIFLVETTLVIDKAQLPSWLPSFITVHDVTSTLHRIFPAYMHGCRCVLGALHGNSLPQRIAALEMVADLQNKLNVTVMKVAKQVRKKLCGCSYCALARSPGGAVICPNQGSVVKPSDQQRGIVHTALANAELRPIAESNASAVEKTNALLSAGGHIRNPSVHERRGQSSFRLIYLVVFVVAVYIWHVL